MVKMTDVLRMWKGLPIGAAVGLGIGAATQLPALLMVWGVMFALVAAGLGATVRGDAWLKAIVAACAFCGILATIHIANMLIQDISVVIRLNP